MKIFIFTSFLLLCSASFAQQHATENTQCQMTVDEILRTQSFDIDEPVSEEARGIVRAIYEDLNAFYKADEDSAQREEHKEELDKTLDKAKELGLNIAMFNEDIDYIFK